MNRLAPIFLSALVLAPAVRADGLHKDRVPSAARWVVHLDIEALRKSRLYDVVREESTKDGSEGLDAGLAHIRAFAGLDPTVDLKSITLYCTVKSEKGCVALLSGNGNVDGALQKLQTMEHYRTTVIGSYALHTWGGDHDTWYAYANRTEGSDERLLVASQDTDQLVHAIALLQGGGETIASAPRAPFLALPSAGSILYAAAGESLNELGEIEPMSAVAKLARTVVLDVGEDRDGLFAHAALDTRKPEDAQRIQQVLQGAVALVALVGDEQHTEARAKLQHIVDAVHLTVSDTRVDADFRYDVKTLIEDLKSLKDLEKHADADKSGTKHKAKHHHEKKSDDDDE
jgi:hypothetical protein